MLANVNCTGGTAMAGRTVYDNESIICDVIGRAPDLQLKGENGGWRLSRWRQFVGSYKLPALPDPMFVIEVAGKSGVRIWENPGWSEKVSYPGCASIVPSGHKTGWLVDGELDVVTLSLPSANLREAAGADRFKRLQFAFSDPLASALTRQVLAELYAPQTPERDIYIDVLMNALKAHLVRGPAVTIAHDIPTSDSFAFRVHQVMNTILQNPGDPHTVESLAAQASVTPSHFCRIFKRATGVSPHQYVMKTRFDRAQQLLLQSDTRISLIAESLGFTSQSHFSRAFRQITGQTPVEFRRRGRAQFQ
jgi:AraC family transcriptional regulator